MGKWESGKICFGEKLLRREIGDGAEVGLGIPAVTALSLATQVTSNIISQHSALL